MAKMLAKSIDKTCCDYCGGKPNNKLSRRANRTPEGRQWRKEAILDVYEARDDAYVEACLGLGISFDRIRTLKRLI